MTGAMIAVGYLAYLAGATVPFVPNESGFDGAVLVSESHEEDGVLVTTVTVPYRDVRGAPKLGEARLFVSEDRAKRGETLPAFCHVHYEKDLAGAKSWCRRGWAVSTAHYKEAGGQYPIDVSIGDGYNLARAILEWVRRLPAIDRTHLHIDGGSQGGYMALAMSADFFPVSATTADCPVVNWAYNLAYFEANKGVSGWPRDDFKTSPLPVLCAVTMLTDWAYGVFGKDLSSETWYNLSPIAWLDWIANPVLIVCATGDMLVPMEQMTRGRLPAFDALRFPEDYRRDLDALTQCPAARKTFDECVPKESLSVERMPIQEDGFEVTLGMFSGEEPRPDKRPKNQDRPWSKDRQWSVCVLDEGPPAPYAAHTTYEWATSPNAFVAAYRRTAPAPETLTPEKLDRLLQRYEGRSERTPTLADGTTCNRLNYAALERLDVATGLLDFAELGDAHLERLRNMYAAAKTHPLGESLDRDRLRALREEIRAGLKEIRQDVPQ